MENQENEDSERKEKNQFSSAYQTNGRDSGFWKTAGGTALSNTGGWQYTDK